MGIAHAQLFGSVARDEADDSSDVDVFVKPRARSFSLFKFAHVKNFLQDSLGCSVDVITRGSLENAPPSIKERVSAEIVSAF
jgi:predicted nucleotidyltransferase